MKTTITLMILALALAVNTKSYAQNNAIADGSVWAVSFVRNNAGMDVAGFNNLKTNWKAVQDEAIKQGLIVSYSIISGVSTATDDYNMALMVEYKNRDAIYSQDEKWEAIQSGIISNADTRARLNNIRTSQNTMS
jgi:hypothetical protein